MDSTHKWWSEQTIAVVTGGNRGIGLEVVRQLARHGLAVVLTSRDQGRGMEACNSLVGEGLQNVVYHELDVESPGSVANFAAWLKQKYGGLDILINNAAFLGISVDSNVVETNRIKLDELLLDASATDLRKKVFIHDYESGRSCIDINYYGVKRTTEALIPLFRPSPAGARIINVSSSAGQIKHLPNESLRQQLTHPETLTEDFIDGMVSKYLEDLKEGNLEGKGWPEGSRSYNVSKIAMNAYSRILARKLATRPEGEKTYTNLVYPGWVRTEMMYQTGKLSVSEGAEGVVWVALLPRDAADGGSSAQFFAFKEPFEF